MDTSRLGPVPDVHPRSEREAREGIPDDRAGRHRGRLVAGLPDGTSVPAVTEARWHTEVVSAPGIVVVACHAPSSGPCAAFEPTLDGLVDTLDGRARVMTLNLEEHGALAARYDVSSIPTLLIFRAGRVTARIVGSRRRERLVAELIRLLPAEPAAPTEA